MKKRKFDETLDEVREELKYQWDKLTQRELNTLEAELDRMVALLQDRYDYTREQAIKSVESFVEEYGERARDALHKRLEQLRQEPARAFPLIWIALAVISGTVLLTRLRK